MDPFWPLTTWPLSATPLIHPLLTPFSLPYLLPPQGNGGADEVDALRAQLASASEAYMTAVAAKAQVTPYLAPI